MDEFIKEFYYRTTDVSSRGKRKGEAGVASLPSCQSRVFFIGLES